MTSPAFLIDCSMPLILAVILSDIAAPAASSPAFVILLPVDSLCIESSMSLSVFLAALTEYNALVFELIDGMFISLSWLSVCNHCANFKK